MHYIFFFHSWFPFLVDAVTKRAAAIVMRPHRIQSLSIGKCNIFLYIVVVVVVDFLSHSIVKCHLIFGGRKSFLHFIFISFSYSIFLVVHCFVLDGWLNYYYCPIRVVSIDFRDRDRVLHIEFLFYGVWMWVCIAYKCALFVHTNYVLHSIKSVAVHHRACQRYLFRLSGTFVKFRIVVGLRSSSSAS